MKYYSTRGNGIGVTSAQAIKQGLAQDGGLFLPESIPALQKDEIDALCKMDYPHRAAYILGKYLTDYTEEELLEDCQNAYGERFVGGTAPLCTVGELNLLELWHGPTCAFKDMALQIMPRLLSRALKKTGETREAVILVATSGDTGKAALEGYRDVPGVRMQVFYPVNGVSRVQKLQMATQEGSNVCVTSVIGNFDDAQTGVKNIFSDDAIAETLDKGGYFFSSANSINWGRLVPQIVYYVSAYCDLILQGKIKNGESMNVCVPTGNFGNIFAAYLAKRMGLPIAKFLCASNSNHILTDFLATGTYDRNRDFYTTMSPSMDILISSNLERLLFLLAGSERTTAYMKALKETGRYTVDADVLAKIQEEFYGYYADESQTSVTIQTTYEKEGYLCDTHTAVGVYAANTYRKETGDTTPIVVASTASPYKFAADVFASLCGKRPEDEFSALALLSQLTGTAIPAPLANLDKKEIRFDPDAAIKADTMPQNVLAQLGL